MSQDIFNQRIARISGKTAYGRSDMAQGEGTAVLMFSSPLHQKKTARRNVKPVLMGSVLGMIVGVTLAGSVTPGSYWGPGSAYVEYVKLPAVLGLVLAPLLVVLGVILQKRFPKFFFTTVGYFPAVLAAALFAEPMTQMVQSVDMASLFQGVDVAGLMQSIPLPI
ncbi:MAG: hypothetical protein ACSHWZ_07790 [Sulfitobacter sp.]